MEDKEEEASWGAVCVSQVLVMTPQILLNVLRLAFVNLGMVHLLVLDECHHAHAQHPYAQIMRVRGGKRVEKTQS